ncbi:MAG: caspase family protein [Elusimicrobia bacterium]|nr:caspase family protein [Elusimicrobiota bacterium]
MTLIRGCSALSVLTIAAAVLSGCTVAPIMRAVVRGDTQQTLSLLDQGAGINERYSQSEFMGAAAAMTPLALAACRGDVKMVQILAARGADVNAMGGYPLLCAAKRGGKEVSKLLLSLGATTNEESLSREEMTGLLALGWRPKDVSIPAPEGGVAAAPRAAEPISRQDLEAIVTAAIRSSVASQETRVPAESGPRSDIDTPAYRLPERPDDFAVVFGVGRYSDIPEARFAERDAEAMKKHLLALGFPSRNVIHLAGEKAGYKSIEKFLETWLPKNVKSNSRVFFYFSGHGAPDPRTGEAYLLPWDGDPNFLENTGYPIKRLYEELSSLQAREVIVAMDACFSGAGGRSVLAKGARPLVANVDTAIVPRKLTVFAAASGDQELVRF